MANIATEHSITDQARLRPARRLYTGVRWLIFRPEATAVAGCVIAYIYFVFAAGGNGFLTQAATLNYLEVAATVGILAVPVTLLLIAGEFDLSVGAQVAATGVVVSHCAVNLQWNFMASFLAGLVVAVAIGTFNGALVAKTPIPSFLVTLATMYVLSGLTVPYTRHVTNGQTTIAGLNDVAADNAFYSLFRGELLGLPAAVWWWIGITVAGALLLTRTKFGNWIYSTGGNDDAAIRMGIPSWAVKITCYAMLSCSATVTAVLLTAKVNTIETNTGSGMEFQAAVAAVIGGALISGGYGSPIGSFFGAFLFGMVSQGFFFTDVDGAYFSAFLGVMLLVAVAVNEYVRGIGMRARVKKKAGS